MLVRRRAIPLANAYGGERRLPLSGVPARGGVNAQRRPEMIVRVRPLWLAVLVLLSGGWPDARAAGMSLLGTWQIVEAQPGPWLEQNQQAAYAAEGKRLLKLAITFAPQQVKSKYKALNCASSVIYETNSLEADALFQGNLPEPNPSAAALRMGFAKGEVPGVDVRCVNANYTFHFRDANTVLFNMNSVIYTLKRQ